MDFKPGDAVKCSKLRGVACRIVKPYMESVRDMDTEDEWTEPEQVPGEWMIRMVGDDHLYRASEEQLQPIDEEEFCGSCGQIGCMHGRPAS